MWFGQSIREVMLCRVHTLDALLAPRVNQSTGWGRFCHFKTAQPAPSLLNDHRFITTRAAGVAENLQCARHCTSQAMSPLSPIITPGSRHTTIFHKQTRKRRLAKLKVIAKISASKRWSWDSNPITAHTPLATNQPGNSQLD